MSDEAHFCGGDPRPESLLDKCPEHPDAPYEGGYGLAGGGMGAYCICTICGTLFGKVLDREDDE